MSAKQVETFTVALVKTVKKLSGQSQTLLPVMTIVVYLAANHLIFLLDKIR